MSAERWLVIAACVCWASNVGSCASSFVSMVCSCAISSSSSDEGAVVFCECAPQQAEECRRWSGE